MTQPQPRNKAARQFIVTEIDPRWMGKYFRCGLDAEVSPSPPMPSSWSRSCCLTAGCSGGALSLAQRPNNVSRRITLHSQLVDAINCPIRRGSLDEAMMTMPGQLGRTAGRRTSTRHPAARGRATRYAPRAKGQRSTGNLKAESDKLEAARWNGISTTLVDVCVPIVQFLIKITVEGRPRMWSR